MFPNQIHIDITYDNSGELMGAYFRIREGVVKKTRSISSGLMIADYDDGGKLLGVEMLGPCEGKVFDSIKIEKQAKVQIRRAAPRELITA